MFDIVGLIGLFIAGVAAGAVNSVAGGGTLISFPSLVEFGQSETVSNATNTAALWPGSFSSAVGYRKDTPLQVGLVATLIIPSFVGGILGAVIFVITPPSVFKIVVPFLVLFATLLFGFRKIITSKITHGKNESREYVSTKARVWGFCFQLFVATYGGYFGAGIGILMLGSLSIMGLHDIHKMNAIKTTLTALINMTAFVFFALRGLVAWELAVVVGVGAIFGGYAGARSAKRIDPSLLQLLVVAIGLIVSAWLFVKLIR
jgi:hypothetical protein